MSLDILTHAIENNINNNSYKDALKLINIGLKSSPFESILYHYMSLTYENLKEYDLAYLSLENALQYSTDTNRNNLLYKLKDLKEKSNVNNFSIIILTHNNLAYTKECIDSIKRNNKLINNYEIIVVDNNSTDDTQAWLKAQKDIKCIFNSKNEGFPKGCNIGINNAYNKNDIFLLNNDTLVTPNSIFTLRMSLYSNENISSVSPSSNYAPYQNIDKVFETKDEYLSYSKEINIYDKSLHEYRLKLIGFALLIKREALNKTGLLDELFSPGNYEDDDYGLRLISNSYYNLYCKDSKINILDIGCACGGTLLKIKSKYPNANLYGVDKNESFKDIAENFADIKILDVETDDLNYEEGYFDYIILADLLQYIDNPLKLLVNLKKYLKRDGHVIASITNANNYKIIKDILNGDSYYNNKGYIFNNRINHFTYKDIQKLFEDADYKDIYITSMASDIKDDDYDFINKLSNLSKYKDIKDELINYEYYIKVTTHTLPFEDINNEFNILVKELDKNYNNSNLLNNLLTLITVNSISLMCYKLKINDLCLKLIKKAYELNPYDVRILNNLLFILSNTN